MQDEKKELPHFVGRQTEIHQLQRLVQSKKSSLAVIYGRRRIGKSSLIREAFKDQFVLYFEGVENQSKSRQITHFLSQLSYQVKNAHPQFSVKNWSDVFLQLVPIISSHQSVVIVLDEFQWMANYRSELVSELKMIWDQYFTQKGKVILILCGSIASFMISKVIRSSSFYGRIQLMIHLKEFFLSESSQMLNQLGVEEILESHLLLGGVPLYLELLNDRLKQDSSVRLGIQNLAFLPNSYFVEEYERVFVSHFGKNLNFKKIISTLALHPYGLSREELSRFTKITLGGNFSQELFNLESAGFISSVRPYDKGEKSKFVKYYLSDAYLRFYFSFIEPNFKKIKSGAKDIFLQLTQKAVYASWLGISFEYLCAYHASKISEKLGFSGIGYTVGSYFQSYKKGTGIGGQIDLLFDREDNVLTLCELKYTNNPVGIDVISEVEKKIEILPLKKKKTLQKILITKSPPSTDLLKKAYFYKILRATDLL
ncbi:MAG: ATP-binding protein [Deltaproteobacteria bacterium]|nr:ATP-binding protein [Deltaproteobacteria bacterium]